MKKKGLLLLTAAAMILGLAQTAFADEVTYYEGVVEYYNKTSYETTLEHYEDQQIEVDATVQNGILKGQFVAENGDVIEFWNSLESEWYTGEMDESAPVGTKINGESMQYTSAECKVIGEEIQWLSKGGIDYEGDAYMQYSFFFNLHPVEAPTNPQTHQISEGFLGSAMSDRGEYDLYIAGYFEKELSDGTYALSTEEINNQVISIVAYHKADGVKRVMTQSTVEEMSVTVSGGSVTEYVIRGRVQTSGGSLDRYTATIHN